MTPIRTSSSLAALLVLATLPACVAPGPAGSNLYASAPLTRAEEPVLYARDGSPVGRAPIEVEAPGTTRSVEGEAGSRLYLLELYQVAVEEKDALQRELETTNALLVAAQKKNTELGQALDQELTRVVSMRERERALGDENRELAARLTTAQIRRLEAEKLLLEAKLQWDEQVLAGRGAGRALGDTEPMLPMDGEQR